MKYNWLQIEDMFVNQGLSISDIVACIPGANISSITTELKRRKLGKYSIPTRIDRVNHNAVDLSSPEFSYLLGWIITDGHISEAKGSVRIAVQHRDAEVLNKLAKILGLEPSRYVTTRANCSELGIHSSKFCSFLKVKPLTIPKDKTFKCIVPEHIMNSTNSFIASMFIRGVIEGDGCIYNGSRATSLSVVTASKTFAYDLITLVEKYTSCKLNCNQGVSTAGNYYYRLRCSGTKAIRILDWVYLGYSDLMLDRKYNKYLRGK